ncbi:hypothetical protein DLM76_18240, partial [Leptospira yasudae]|uniref:polymorphic toxin-type HINT domain-containing protein n=1 Tax=Leptospira yasudae TaxID=2202201 RepID=UPI000EC04C5E
ANIYLNNLAGNAFGEFAYVDSNGNLVFQQCFVAGTLVHTKTGLKKIEEIQVGDEVLTKDEETGEVFYKPVTETMNHDGDALYEISLGTGETIVSTWNHPYFTSKSGWVKAKDLLPGDQLIGTKGEYISVSDTRELSQSEKVYNFEVEETHSYFVGEKGVWVHNYENTSAYELSQGQNRMDTNQKIFDAMRTTLPANDKTLIGNLLDARKQIAEGDSNRIKIAQEQAAQDPEYKRLSEKNTASKKAYDALKVSVDNAIRLAPDDPSTKKLNSLLNKIKADIDTSQIGMQNRVAALADKIPNSQALAGRILLQATQDLSKDSNYLKNIDEIAKLRAQKENDITGSILGSTCGSLCVDTSVIDGKIAQLESQNAALLEGYKKANEANIALYQKTLGTDGLKRIDNTISNLLQSSLQTGLKAAYSKLDNGNFPAGSIFANNNVTPQVEAVQGANYFDPTNGIARSINEGSPGNPRNANGMPYQSEVNDVIANRLNQSPPGTMNATTYADALNAPFKKLPAVTDANRSQMGLSMTEPRLNNQGQNNSMAVQASVIMDVIRSGGKDNFQMDPQLKSQFDQATNQFNNDRSNLQSQFQNGSLTLAQYNTKLDTLQKNFNASDVIVRGKEFQAIKDWVFSGNSSMQLGNAMAAAICKMNTNFTQAYLDNKTNLSFGEYVINKFRNADVRFNGNNAPIYDMNGFRGYDTKIVNAVDSSGNRISNNFEGMKVDPTTGKVTGIVNPLTPDTISNTISHLKPGSIVQIYWDTDINAGPNHFSLAEVGPNGELFDLNNNGERNNGAASIIDKTKLIYGIYYNQSNVK